MYKGTQQDDATVFLRIYIYCYAFKQIYIIISGWSPAPTTTLSQEISKMTWEDTELIGVKERSKTLYFLFNSILWCLFQYHRLAFQLCNHPSGALTRAHLSIIFANTLLHILFLLISDQLSLFHICQEDDAEYLGSWNSYLQRTTSLKFSFQKYCGNTIKNQWLATE